MGRQFDDLAGSVRGSARSIPGVREAQGAGIERVGIRKEGDVARLVADGGGVTAKPKPGRPKPVSRARGRLQCTRGCGVGTGELEILR